MQSIFSKIWVKQIKNFFIILIIKIYIKDFIIFIGNIKKKNR